MVAATIDSSIHLNLIFLIALAVFLGTVAVKLFQKMHIPQVVGCIVIGTILGGSALKLIDGCLGPDRFWGVYAYWQAE